MTGPHLPIVSYGRQSVGVMIGPGTRVGTSAHDRPPAIENLEAVSSAETGEATPTTVR